ncbi:uncharacterized protein LOC127001546 isoform X2 [Eriocheir sinensis]|uniref:uncharacterized protein LOC127001546 isoform X2 n=1 Tax=Eriocheir sinensis TaxID=95602 RepID=UPI0021C6D404|nr:uncharacterized protein LOC127001546 isoform X2 [Eriocheir sinensis]
MAANGLFAAVLVMALLGLGASVVEDKNKDKAEKDARFFLPILPTTGTTGSGTVNPLLTLGGDSTVYVGLTIAGLTAAVIVLGILLAIAVGFGYKNNGSDFFGHSATPYYGSSESSYTAYRNLEKAAKKYED